MSELTEICRVPETDQAPPENSVATTILLDATEEEAERQGAWAYTFGLDPDVNPYAGTGSKAANWWIKGYREYATDDAQWSGG